MHNVLPDVLRPGLKLVICGSAAGAVSAARGAYYAGPGNKFWPILAATGLTPRQLDPAEYRQVLDYGIGLTDIVKTASGSDASLPRHANDVAGFVARVRLVRPRIVAFNGKRAAGEFYKFHHRRHDLDFGFGEAVADFPPVWILPSTSGSACRFWTSAPWQQLAGLIRSWDLIPNPYGDCCGQC